jgi:hypothetical protein
MRNARFLKPLAADTTAATVAVNVTGSIPNGLFPGTDTFDVGSQTIVLGNSGSTLLRMPASVSPARAERRALEFVAPRAGAARAPLEEVDPGGAK